MKYGGYTAPQLRSIVKQSRQSEEGLDSIFGDGAVAPTIIRDLLNHLRDLKGKSADAALKSTAKPASKQKATKQKRTKKVVARFPSFT